LFLVIADWLVGRFDAVWQRHSPDDYALRVAACAREPRDLVFLGGSPVAEGIDPARFPQAKSDYALGLSGGTMSDFYHAVLRACPTPPKRLVYGVSVTDLNDSRHEPHGAYSLMTPGDVARWVKLRPEAGEWVVRHYALGQLGKASNLFRYRHGIRMWAATEASERLPDSCPESQREADELRDYADRLIHGNGYAPLRGFRQMDWSAVKAAGKAPTSFPYLVKYRTGSHLKYLLKLIDWCEANQVELVLVEMPVTADLERMYTAEFAEYRKRLTEVEQTHNVRVIRAGRDAVGLEDRHFADLIHLNCDGARTLSDWLAARMAP
jgi:hypothetical protein